MTTLRDQINAAVGAHGLWKGRLVTAIQTGKCEHNSAKVEQDNQCDFGKWLHQTIDAASKGAPDYKAVKEMHARFHKEAAKVLRLVEGKKIDDAKKALDGDYAKISSDLVGLLVAWKSKAN